MTDKEICIKAVSKFGRLPQLDKTVEECAELIQAIQKHHTDKSHARYNNVVEEAADVSIMLDQIKYIFLCEEQFDRVRKLKLERLEGLLKD